MWKCKEHGRLTNVSTAKRQAVQSEGNKIFSYNTDRFLSSLGLEGTSVRADISGTADYTACLTLVCADISGTADYTECLTLVSADISGTAGYTECLTLVCADIAGTADYTDPLTSVRVDIVTSDC
jgi:hypothetical protein